MLLNKYDDLYLESKIDTTPLLEFASLHYGRLLDHEAPDPQVLQQPPILNNVHVAEVPSERTLPLRLGNGLVNIDTNPTYAHCVAVSSISIRTSMEELIEELQAALFDYPIDLPRFVSSLQDLNFMTTQPHGNQFTVLVPLLGLTAF